eukprot:TRINITY_DN19311_c3_g1_i1.p1 TRINITY_DN19311_c3_g1~~TRINITY_DN19311_c3_g1_i1.p1  ORF type:complete len:231 (+),score=22.85 TRINITY_DN19311_c3_g1_i1:2-694(+)
MPIGLFSSWVTLFFFALLTFFISSAIPPGVASLAKNNYPLLLGFQYAFGNSKEVKLLCLTLTVGLLSSLHAFVFATGQLLAEMAHDSQLPRFLARRSRTTGSPWVALCISSTAAFSVLLLIYEATGCDADKVGVLLISGCLVCTLMSYMVQLSCFVYLRLKSSNEMRVFASPFGVVGGILALLLCIFYLMSVLCLPMVDRHFLIGILLALGTLTMMWLIQEIVKWFLKSK